MEMKRAHQELLSEVDSLHEKTRQSSNEHCDVVYRLTQEMAEQKVSIHSSLSLPGAWFPHNHLHVSTGNE